MLKGILMNTEMVKAILAGRKTVTRRLIKLEPADNYDFVELNNDPNEIRVRKNGEIYFHKTSGLYATFTSYIDGCPMVKAPYRPDDVLYVRESWCKGSLNGGAEQYFYNTDYNDFHCQWHPSIHMPKEAARIFLRVTGVRVERLQDITNDDLERDFNLCEYAIPAIGREQIARIAWDSTIKKADLAKYGWDANPWVWVIEFERISKEEALKND